MIKIFLNKKRRESCFGSRRPKNSCYINGTASRKAKDDVMGGSKIYWRDSFLLSEKENNTILTLLEDHSFPCYEEKGEKIFLVDISYKIFLF